MRVAVVSGIVVDRDAISGSVAWHVEMLSRLQEVSSVSVFAEKITRDLPCQTYEVRTSWDLLRHPEFRDADVAIFHFGIRYDLFNVLTLLPADDLPVPVVQFHNVTPRELVPERDRHVIDLSMLQAELIARAEHVWADSQFNHDEILRLGVDPERCEVLTIPVVAPAGMKPVRGDGQRVLYVGRIVQAKGIEMLLDAFEHVPAEVRRDSELVLCGNTSFSDPGFLTALDSRVEASPILRDHVRIVREPSDQVLWNLYFSSDVFITASRHEGLCIPIVEASLAGCHIVATANSNIAYLVPPEQLAPVDDAVELSRLLTEGLKATRSGPAAPLPCVSAHDPAVVTAAIRRSLSSIRGVRRPAEAAR